MTPRTLGRVGAGGRHQERLLLARELALSAGARLLAERRLQVAFDEAAFGPVRRRTANADVQGDVLIAHTRVGSQQDLRSLQLARGCLPLLSSPLSSSRSAWLRSTG